MSEITIANVVGADEFGQELEIEQIGVDLYVPETEYDPSNYHGPYVRLNEDGPLITVIGPGSTSFPDVPISSLCSVQTNHFCRN